MRQEPLPAVTADTDARTAWASDRVALKVCNGKLGRGAIWYRDLQRDLAGEKRK